MVRYLIKNRFTCIIKRNVMYIHTITIYSYRGRRKPFCITIKSYECISLPHHVQHISIPGSSCQDRMWYEAGSRRTVPREGLSKKHTVVCYMYAFLRGEGKVLHPLKLPRSLAAYGRCNLEERLCSFSMVAYNL